MRQLSIAIALCCSLAGCAAEAPRASTPPAATAPNTSFTPPDASGFGRAGELIYLEEILGDAAPSDALPMLVLIHGRGDKPARGWLPIHSNRPVRVIMPRAPLPFGDGYSWFANRALTAIGSDGAELGKALVERADQIQAAVEILKRHRPTKGLPLAGGFSQGGMLSYTLAVRHPHSFRALLPIAGLLPEALLPSEAPSPPLPSVIALHGDADPVVPIDGARNAVTRLQELGYHAQLHQHEGVPHTITPSMQTTINAWLGVQLDEP